MTNDDKIELMNQLRPTTEVMTSLHNTLSRSTHFPTWDDVQPDVIEKKLNELIKLTEGSLEMLNKWKGKIK